VLATDQSKALRDRLIAELSDLQSADEAAGWVHENLPAKNTLAHADAETVEASFRERLAAIEGGQPGAGIAELVDNSSVEHLQDQSQPLGPETLASPATVVRRRSLAAKSTVSSWPRNLASSAVAPPPKRFIFASPNPER
jgi:hypothetical protein